MTFIRLSGYQPGYNFSALRAAQSRPAAGNAGSSSEGSTANDADATLEEGFYVVKGGLSDAFAAAFDALQDAPGEVLDTVKNTFVEAKSVMSNAFQQVRDAVANVFG